MGFNINFSWNRSKPIDVTRDNKGNWWYTMFSSTTSSKFKSDFEKLQIVFSNPAMLKVIAINADLFSLGLPYAGEDNQEDLLTDKIHKPNYVQTSRQFLWDYMCFNMLGTANLYAPSRVLNEKTPIYWLNPARLEFPQKTLNELDKIILTEKSFKKLQDLPVRYNYDDGTYLSLKLKEIKPFFDLSNNTSGNWYKGQSRIDALYKVLNNVEEGLTSKGVNLRFAGKHIVTGNADPMKNMELPMGSIDKDDVESKIMSSKPVHAVKQEVKIERFVDDMRKLQLDEAYLASYFIIGNMYNTPREVLQLELQGGIGDKGNAADKARASHVTYYMQPKGDDMLNGMADFFGLPSGDYIMSWNHLPFMRANEETNADIRNKDADSFKKLTEGGATPESAAEELGYNNLTFNKDNGKEDTNN